MKKFTKLASVLAAGALIAGVVAGCGGGGEKKAEAPATIKIGGLLEMTGGSASYGISAKRAIDIAISEINAKGGVTGKKLELVVADNKSEAAEAANGMQKLVSQDKVVAVIGPNLSSLAISSIPIHEGAKILAIAPMATNPDVTVDPKTGKTHPYNFRSCFIDPFQGTVMANFVAKDLKALKTAILIDNSSDYAKGLAKNFKETYEKIGGQIVGEEAYLQKDTDFKATMTKIKATNPDFIYIPGYYQEIGLAVKQGRDLGITVPMGGGDGWDSTLLPEIAGKEALNNTYFTSLYSPDDATDLNKAFVAAYEKAYKAKPDVFAAMAYDCTLLVAKAIEDAKGPDPVKMAEAMAKIKGLKGVAGETTFDAQHNPIKTAVIIEYKDGAQVFKGKVEP